MSGLPLALGERFTSLRFAFQPPSLQVVCELLRNVNHRQALLRFSPVTNLALVDSLRNRECRCRIVEALPTKSEEFARTQSVRHVELKQDAISKTQLRESEPIVNGTRRVVFISADDDGAKKQVGTLLADFGYSVIDLGNLRDGGLIQQAGGPLAGRSLLEEGERQK
jgi:hypothetical protein